MSGELTRTSSSGNSVSSGGFADERSTRIVVFYLGRAMEAVWLLAAFAVPVIILTPGILFGHVDIPKVGLVKSAAVLIAMLWLIQLVVAPGIRLPGLPLAQWRSIPPRLAAWLRADPHRWAMVALAALLAAYVLSVVFSASPNISVWGRRPGSDSYGLHQMASVALLGLAVAVHLRDHSQVYRLLGVIAAAGTVVGIYAVSQHFGFDPIRGDLAQTNRIESSMGSPIFAATVLLMTSLSTVTVGLMAWIQHEHRRPILAMLVTLATTVQVLGLIYTLSRGPWIGTVFGAFALVVLMWVAGNRDQLGRRLATTVAVTIFAATLIAIVTAAAIVKDETVNKLGPNSPLTRAISIPSEAIGGGTWVSDRLT